MSRTVPLAVLGLALVGCGASRGSFGKPPAKTSQKQIDDVIADSRYTPAQKTSSIQSIKGRNGLPR